MKSTIEIMKDEYQELFDENQKYNKALQRKLVDIDKLKEKIKKLKLRKGKGDQTLKMCKLCNKEYKETENFSWKCRTHWSEFGGELWWCCGKSGFNQPGCKLSKHECVDDVDVEDDEEDEDEKMKKELSNLSKVKCGCCKQFGHKTNDCVKDPNFKTNNSIASEMKRLREIKDTKTLFGDTKVTTTHLLKNCVKIKTIPKEVIKYDSVGAPIDHAAMVERQNKVPFQRGALTFEDFNYAVYNEHILIDPTLEESDQELKERGGFQPKKNVLKNKDNKVNKSQSLNTQNLEMNYVKKYYQELTSVLSEQEQEEKEKETDKNIGYAVADDQNQEDNQKRSENNDESSGDLASQSNSYDQDDVEYKIFYDIKEIKETIKKQDDDPFTNIVEAKRENSRERETNRDTENLINIIEFAPDSGNY